MAYHWMLSDVGEDEKKIPQAILPPDYEYQIIAYDLKEKSEVELESKFDLKARVKLGNCSIDSVNAFLDEFYRSSGATFNKFRGDKKVSEELIDEDGNVDLKMRVIYSGYRKCQHRVSKRISPLTGEMARDGRSQGVTLHKNTRCSSMLKFTLKNHNTNHKNDCQEFALEIDLTQNHNHTICCADALRFHPVSNDTRTKYIELFMKGLTAMEAYHTFRKDLDEEFGGRDSSPSADRSQCPDRQWVFREHAKFNLARFGRLNSVESFQLTADKLREYNTINNQELSRLKQFPDGHYIVGFLDPLMLRVHKNVKQAGDICGVDSTGNVDRIDSRVFHFVCPSPAGSLPLATLITSSESEDVLTEGFQLIKDLLPSYAWFGRGAQGPKYFITDDCCQEINSLSKVWPASVLLLCIFHVLQGSVHKLRVQILWIINTDLSLVNTVNIRLSLVDTVNTSLSLVITLNT